MLHNKKLLLFVLVIFCAISLSVYAKYIPTNKDTKLPPDTITYDITEPTEYQLLHENKNFKFYYKEERDIFAVYDIRNGYTWKTGLDAAHKNEIERACEKFLKDNPEADNTQILDACQPFEFRNDQLLGLVNSLVSIEYYPNQTTLKETYSSAATGSRSTLGKVNNDPTHRLLDVKFSKIDVSLKVHVYLTEDGLAYEIKKEDLTGKDANKVTTITFNPFLGASGGEQYYYDIVKKKYSDEAVANELIDGYILLPDGSGSLMRFQDYNVSLSVFNGDVYGEDYSRMNLHYRNQPNFVLPKSPVMPVFGIAHGNRQAAFVAYAEKGAEFMEIIGVPDNNRKQIQYAYAHPRFLLNEFYNYIYNQQGQGYPTLFEEPNRFDIKMNYDFLAGDGSKDNYPADYIGMAKKYRNHLIEKGILTPTTYQYEDTPIRLDFLMADAKKNILGYEDVIVTRHDDVEDILNEIVDELGIKNINSGLYGYQKGGVTLGNINKPKFSSSIGSFNHFKSTINNLKEKGIDVSFATDYLTINEEQMSLAGNATRHTNNWYIRHNLFDRFAPVTQTYYAKPEKAVSWLASNTKAVRKIEPLSTTIEGMSNILYSDYGKRPVKVTDTISMYQEAFSKVNKDYKINAKTPNMYLWQYVDRFLQAPVYSSQYITSTDTVPFLQIVLNGTMEVYAPYANFSFYQQSDILRMIDYNVYPSFILTKEPSYLLLATNSANYYSTEYQHYKGLIDEIYKEVNGALNQVINYEWVDREVVENGVIVNSYKLGLKTRKIVINYTNESQKYGGKIIRPLSYDIIE